MNSTQWLTRRLFVIFFLVSAMPAQSMTLEDYLWKNRVIITFSSDEQHPERLSIKEQIDLHRCGFRDRDLVHIDLIQGSAGFDEMSQKFSVSGEGFQLLLLGKDGGVKKRTSTVSLEEVFSLIDTMPMRRREMRDDDCQ